MRRSFYSFILIVLSHLSVYSQTSISANTDLSSKIKNYFVDHIKERVYLQFDKPYYAAGDTIYFKAYLTMGERHEPSTISGVLYVDFINSVGEVKQSEKLQVLNGVAWGDFALLDELPQGHYQIRAYTNWMRNEGADSFFNRIIPIGTFKRDARPVTSGVKQQLQNSKNDFQFFPEGGNLVTGLNSKIAFKAIGINGLGIGVKGTITDDNNKMICSFTSSHLGMGYLNLKPEKGRSYKANLIYADGTQGTVDLPKPETSGLVLSVNNDSLPKTTVKIQANDAYYALNKDSNYYLLIYSGGSTVTINYKLDSPVVSFDILKRRLPTGVARATLFSGMGEPMCERLFFIQNYNQLNLLLTTDKKQFSQREKVNVKIEAKNRADDPATGQFSVAVLDENKVPFDEDNEHTILTDLLLTDDLKGYIEKPNYYFHNINDQATKDLDLVMLTHGYSRFEWKSIIKDESKPNSFEPERGLEVSGFAKSLSGKQPVKAGMVTLIPVEGGYPLTGKTDDDGHFSFKHLFFTDTLSFVLKAVNAKGKDLTKIIYNERKAPTVLPILAEAGDEEVNESIPAYIKNNEKQQEQINKYGLGKAKMLQEVQVRSKRNPIMVTKYGIPGQVISGDKIGYGGTLKLRLAGLIFVPGYITGPPLVVVDGVEMPSDFDINSIDPGNVKEVAAIVGGVAVGSGAEYVIIINTTHGLQTRDMIVTGLLPIRLVGFYKARQFYSPQYDVVPSSIEDLRTTIYWNPNLGTDKDGSVSFNFYNSDGAGTYRVTVEGMDDKGNVGRTVYRYHVN